MSRREERPRRGLRTGSVTEGVGLEGRAPDYRPTRLVRGLMPSVSLTSLVRCNSGAAYERVGERSAPSDRASRVLELLSYRRGCYSQTKSSSKMRAPNLLASKTHRHALS